MLDGKGALSRINEEFLSPLGRALRNAFGKGDAEAFNLDGWLEIYSSA